MTDPASFSALRSFAILRIAQDDKLNRDIGGSVKSAGPARIKELLESYL
jgi:hypothetical protein